MDIATLALLLAVVSLLSFISLALLGWSFSFQQGTNKWMWGSLCQGVGSILILLQGQVGSFWGILVANLLLFSSYILFLEGLRKFRDLPPQWRVHAIFLFMMAGLFIVLYDSPDFFPERVQLNSLGLSLYSTAIIIHLLQNKKFSSISSALLATSFFLLLLISVGRLIFSFREAGATHLLASAPSAIIFIAGIVIIFLYTVGLVLMVSEREKYLIKIDHQNQIYINQVLDQNLDHHKNFIFAIAHEFVNPIASIQSSEQILKNSSPQDPVFHQELERIDRSLVRMQKTIKDAADINKPLSYLTQQFQEVVNMEEVVKEVCSSYELSYVSKLPYPVGVQSEHTLLKLILSNLVSNALKYCQKISSIHVSIQASGDNTVAVAIENDGVPIPPDQQQRIFEKDFKGEASKSFGFGLFFVKSIVERMKGSIQLEAGGINKFTLNFPVASTLP